MGMRSAACAGTREGASVRWDGDGGWEGDGWAAAGERLGSGWRWCEVTRLRAWAEPTEAAALSLYHSALLEEAVRGLSDRIPRAKGPTIGLYLRFTLDGVISS